MTQLSKAIWMTFTVILMFSLASHVNAEPVTKEMAQGAAKAFLIKEQVSPPKVVTKKKGEFVIRDHAAGLRLGKINPITDENGLVLAYIQELEPEGFIITSADDRMRPVLGFSTSGHFSYDKRNPLIHLITADTKSRRRLMSDSEEVAKDWSAENRAKWASVPEFLQKDIFELEDITEWGPLITTQWSQSMSLGDGYFNDRCPYDYRYLLANQYYIRVDVGCVATAMGQIVNYHGMKSGLPKTISFSDSDRYVSDSKITIRIDEDSSELDFPSLTELDSVLSNISYDPASYSDVEEYNDMIRMLCFGIGVKLKTNYSANRSGACWSSKDYLDDLSFGSANVDWWPLTWSRHKDQVIENIKNEMPVHIGICNILKLSGHSVVVDGYRLDDYFHLNLGWGPLLSKIIPDHQSTH